MDTIHSALLPRLEGRTSLVRCLVASLACIVLGSVPVLAQSPAELRTEIEQMKRDYEARIQTLEQRLAALEKDHDSTKTEVAAIAPKVDKAIQDAVASVGQRSEDAAKAANEIGTTPRYDQLRDFEATLGTLEAKAKAFELHGYFRSGYGVNGRGGQQVAFQAPGATTKYRLGNEAETYGELIFVTNWLNPSHDSDKMWAKGELLVQADTDNSAVGSNSDHFRLKEAFIQVGNVFKDQPNLKFWAGERYYRRQNIDIVDYNFLDMSGYGGGFEDLDTKFGKVAVAFLAGSRQDLQTESGAYSKQNIDVRLYDFKAPGGKMGVWYNAAFSKGGTATTGQVIPTEFGQAIGVMHLAPEFLGGYNKFSVMYGRGPASNFTTTVDAPLLDARDTTHLLVTEHLLFQPDNDRWTMMPVFIYDRKTGGTASGGIAGEGVDTWVSFGARPVVNFTDHLSLAIEAGFDYTKSDARLTQGWLRKITFAPQISAGRDFFSRPVLRLFVTYANWSDDFRGLIGGVPYLNNTNGFSFGVQAEHWW